jgi:hypothetical protein
LLKKNGKTRAIVLWVHGLLDGVPDETIEEAKKLAMNESHKQARALRVQNEVRRCAADFDAERRSHGSVPSRCQPKPRRAPNFSPDVMNFSLIHPNNEQIN